MSKFFVVAPDGLCYCLGERFQAGASAPAQAADLADLDAVNLRLRASKTFHVAGDLVKKAESWCTCPRADGR